MLKVNGDEFDLRKGTVILLLENGTGRQFPLFPHPLRVSKLPELLASLEGLDPVQEGSPGTATTPAGQAGGSSGSGASATAGESRPQPGTPHPPAPAGAVWSREQQVAVPQESRVTVELFSKMNDGERARIGEKLTFKTAAGSGLGVLLRWHVYGPDHPTTPSLWVLDLVDPLNGTIFHRIEDGFGEPVKVMPLDGEVQGKGTHVTLERAGSYADLRLLRAERLPRAGEPLRTWWEVQALVALGAENQADNPPLFQLPSSPPASTPPPAAPDDHANGVTAPELERFTTKATEILQRLPARELKVGREEAVAEATVRLTSLYPELDSMIEAAELRRLLETRAAGAENIKETLYWLLAFRERVRAQTSRP
jgi:hypothetical protein